MKKRLTKYSISCTICKGRVTLPKVWSTQKKQRYRKLAMGCCFHCSVALTQLSIRVRRPAGSEWAPGQVPGRRMVMELVAMCRQQHTNVTTSSAPTLCLHHCAPLHRAGCTWPNSDILYKLLPVCSSPADLSYSDPFVSGRDNAHGGASSSCCCCHLLPPLTL